MAVESYWSPPPTPGKSLAEHQIWGIWPIENEEFSHQHVRFDPWKLMHSSPELICFTGKNMGIHPKYVFRLYWSSQWISIKVECHLGPQALRADRALCMALALLAPRFLDEIVSQVMMLISCWGSSLHGLLHCEAEKLWSLMVIDGHWWSLMVIDGHWWSLHTGAICKGPGGFMHQHHVRWAWIGCKSGLKEMEEHNIHPPKNWLCLQVASLSRIWNPDFSVLTSHAVRLVQPSLKGWKSLKLWKPKATTWHTSCNSWQNNLKAYQNVKKTNSYKFQEFCVRFWVLPVPPCTPEN